MAITTAFNYSVYALPIPATGQTSLVPGDRTNMVWVRPGTFLMGSTTNIPYRGQDEVRHEVTLTSGFYIGKFEVTQGEYLLVMGNNPSHYSLGDMNQPVEQIAWDEASAYCTKLTAQELTAGRIQSGWSYRLPTEAEWEYSCRAGTTTEFSFGDSIHGGDANFGTQVEYDAAIGSIDVPDPVFPSLMHPTTVGSYKPNPWGIFDMHGNAMEYCKDWYTGFSETGVVDPQGSSSGPGHSIRGCSAWNPGVFLRSAWRGYAPPQYRDGVSGFRIVLAQTIPAWKAAITTTNSRQDFAEIKPVTNRKKGLIVITHGWIPPGTSIKSATAWVDSMSNCISQYLTSLPTNDWQVLGYTWTKGARVALPKGPQTALENARQQGVSLGRQILALKYSHVHLIAHSAGAGLIQAATDTIKDPVHGDPSVVVHETFLDPFVGLDFSGTASYGAGADWADNYVAKDSETYDDVLPFTYNILSHSYNVDVTFLDVKNRVKRALFTSGNGEPCYTTTSSHGWPLDFYSNSIVGIVTSQYEGFGFPLSEEGGMWGTALIHTPGNGIPGRVLGTPDPECSVDIPASSSSSLAADLVSAPSIQSDTGTIQIYGNGSIVEKTDSPAWLTSFIMITNAANTVAFNAEFQSSPGAQGLLSVCWDGDIIGTIDERNVGEGFQQYGFKFPTVSDRSLHALGFRLDPFTNIQSVAVLTNIAITAVGVTQPFTLSTTESMHGYPSYRLDGQAGFEYAIQASTDLANWTNIASVVNIDGIVRFFDQDSTNYPYRFYRAVAPY